MVLSFFTAFRKLSSVDDALDCIFSLKESLKSINHEDRYLASLYLKWHHVAHHISDVRRDFDTSPNCWVCFPHHCSHAKCPRFSWDIHLWSLNFLTDNLDYICTYTLDCIN